VQHHRWLSLLALVIVMMGTAGGTAWALVFRTVSSPINLKDALRLYRKDAAPDTATTWRSRLPRPGVYTYRSSGDESLSIMGAARSFPATSALIVTGGACASETWAPLVQHTETTTVCPQAHDAYAIASMATHETIGGSTTDATLACPSTLYLLPPSAHRGQRWAVHCALSNPHEAVTVTGLVLGQTPLTIAGHTVETEHVRLTQRYSEPAAGADPTDFWVEPATGLIVEAREEVAVTQDGVHYHQASDARLVSLSPSR
jgi:hypothetical protein